MTKIYAVSYVILWMLIFRKIHGITSPLQPYTSYSYFIELEPNVVDLWWIVDETKQEITFELHIKTTGWIALGISPAGGMKGADIGLGWIDQSGQVHFQDRYAYNFSRPVIDDTTIDWFALQGHEENGWTAIQFKRFLDTCDSMDVPIKSGTNILIFAYGLQDPDMSQSDGLIYYHENRRGSRVIPLQSYGNPSSEEKFAHLEYIDFQFQDYIVPSTDTTYFCQIFKVPSNFLERRHAIAYKTIIDPNNRDLVHHVVLYECNPTTVFDDNNLPIGVCDEISESISACSANIATTWAVGGDDIVEFPDITGYPIGGDFEIKYYMFQAHYSNPKQIPNRRDSTGIRFYLGKERRQYDLGYLTLGTESSLNAIAIPPGVDRFIIDSYCPGETTKNFPQTGITMLVAFPHTHLQGLSLWTKIIRNQTAVDYLFNAESYDFNFQYQNMLPKPIQLYPGDELATRCVYNTKHKSEITLGGKRTKDEMCRHIFAYYPRMSDLYFCVTVNSLESWKKIMNSSESSLNVETLEQWLKQVTWTSELVTQWQNFFHDASRLIVYGRTDNYKFLNQDKLPEYEDLKPLECKKSISNMGFRQNFSFIFFTFISFFTIIISSCY
ncbi:unnamed protein product [Rotaria sp. Silwood1]|nr:unnamed protein product [Rotaria sp. Silwood1]CAF1552011.1 unnamed protein product [Rotaria sp. Silwood1]CAF3711487.1 unnamed protein product [Rotaria sp. Silwood1]